MNLPLNRSVIDFIVESNRIENIELDPACVEGFIRSADSFPVTSIQLRHARNSVRAFLYAYANFNNKLNMPVLFGLHSRQMDQLLHFPGTYRQMPAHVIGAGGRQQDCPLPSEVPALMANWFEFYAAAPGVEPSWNPLRLHYEFELIHPFADGNGRVGRLLWVMDCLRRGMPIFPILDQFNAHDRSFMQKRDLYYEALQFHRLMRNSLATKL